MASRPRRSCVEAASRLRRTFVVARLKAWSWLLQRVLEIPVLLLSRFDLEAWAHLGTVPPHPRPPRGVNRNLGFLPL